MNESGNIKEWEKYSYYIVELVINSLHNKSTEFSPFYLNYGYESYTTYSATPG